MAKCTHILVQQKLGNKVEMKNLAQKADRKRLVRTT